MSRNFFENPILNTPYEFPREHWQLDHEGQPTGRIVESRRRADFVSPVPKPRRGGKGGRQAKLDFGAEGLSTVEQSYAALAGIINGVRDEVARWRRRTPGSRGLTPESEMLLAHWRKPSRYGRRPFFCQVEAVETLIWLTEVAPGSRRAKRFRDHLAQANEEANPGLDRVALKLATGAGKTMVMAMLIAWQTVNAVRHPTSSRFTRTFLVVTPGITIRDRLRVLQPNDPESYFGRKHGLLPEGMERDLEKAEIVITNYHAFKRREKLKAAAGNKRVLRGRGGDLPIETESEGEMLARVFKRKNSRLRSSRVLVLNDEAHHCYRERPLGAPGEEEPLTGAERDEVRENRKAARLWISGLEALAHRAEVSRVVDLSATPFFLSGSGYAEGTLFPWTITDFSLLDAIECGIVKLPRVPVDDDVPKHEMPMYRELWKHIGKRMPRTNRARAKAPLDPADLPPELQTALQMLYGHFERVFSAWQAEESIESDPCFVVVCNNTASSRLVHDWIAGYHRPGEDGNGRYRPGRLDLFRNFDERGEPLARPRTLLIDSVQLESGEALDPRFRQAAAHEIERFQAEIRQRDDGKDAGKIEESDLLREVLNTVGKPNTLGDSIRCVVSVSMLSEGWDANTVTHILGVRAFGTQLLCEQVVGRALRRQSYDGDGDALLDPEYADVLGVPFDFTAKPVSVPPKPIPPRLHVHAVSPERDDLEIQFPRVVNYRTAAPESGFRAAFNDDSVLTLTTDLVGATEVENAALIGSAADLGLSHLDSTRNGALAYELAARLLETRYRDTRGSPGVAAFSQLKNIARRWLDECLRCEGGTRPAQLMYAVLADRACEKIEAAVTRFELKARSPVRAVLDPYNETGSTSEVDFTTTKRLRYRTDPRRCHIDWAVLDSDWELEFCRVVNAQDFVKRWVRNDGLGFEVPYRSGGEWRRYLPDFIVVLDDGKGDDDLLHLVVEVKGYRGQDARDKKEAMETQWVPGVNALGTWGRWGFAELTEARRFESDLEALLPASIRLFEPFMGRRWDRAARILSEAGGTMPDLEDIPRRRPPDFTNDPVRPADAADGTAS